MTFRGLLVVVAASALGACAGSKPATDPGENDVFTLKFADAPPAPVAAAPTDDASKTDAYTIEFAFVRRDGQRLSAPTVSAYAAQTATVTLATQRPDETSHVEGRVAEGMWLSVRPQPMADGGVSLGYRVRLARLKPAPESSDAAAAAPDRELVEFEGARRMEPRVLGLLARVTSPDGSGPLLVLARVLPIRVDAPPPGSVDAVSSEAKLSGAALGRMLHLRVTAVVVPRPFEPGAVLDETATPDLMKPMNGRILRDFELFTCVDSRVRIAGLLESGDKKNGLVAAGRDDGDLDLSWTTNGVPRTATVRPTAGRRFVALANIEGGGTAGVLVAVDVD